VTRCAQDWSSIGWRGSVGSARRSRSRSASAPPGCGAVDITEGVGMKVGRRGKRGRASRGGPVSAWPTRGGTHGYGYGSGDGGCAVR
jgi:hypothetical protein